MRVVKWSAQPRLYSLAASASDVQVTQIAKQIGVVAIASTRGHKLALKSKRASIAHCLLAEFLCGGDCGFCLRNSRRNWDARPEWLTLLQVHASHARLPGFRCELCDHWDEFCSAFGARQTLSCESRGSA